MYLYTFFAFGLLVNLLFLQKLARTENLETCFLHLVKKYQKQHVLVMADSKSYELDLLMKVVHSGWFFYKKHYYYFEEPITQVSMVLLLYQNSTDIWGALDTIGNFLFDTRVLLIVFNLNETRHDLLDQLYILWTYNFRNAIAVHKHDLKVYSYSPVMSGYCTNVELRSLGKWSNFDYQIFDSNVDMSNCTIRIGASPLVPYFDQSNGGFEAAIFEIVIEKLGVHVEYTVSQMSVLTPMLEMRKLDLLTGGMVPSGDPTNIVVYYSENEMAIFVPVVKPLPPWRNLVHIYDLTTWICLLASIAAITIFWHLAHKKSHVPLLYIICSLISSFPHTPTIYKPLFALWMLFTLILTNAFNGLLISFMFKPLYDRQISSVDDLILQNWRINDTTLYPFFINDTNIEMLGNRHSFCFFEGSKCFYQLSQDKVAFASTLRNFNYMANLHGYIDVHKFNSMKFFLIFRVSYRSKYKIKIQEVAGRMFEVGLVQHLDVYNFEPTSQIFDKHYKPVALKHLYLIIGFYFAGLLAAVLAFFQELRRLQQ